MGLLTFEHGRTAYALDFVMYGATVAALAVFLLLEGPRDQRLAIATLALAGLVSWTLVEYLLHRFILHGLQPFRDWHAEHHRRPGALIGTPTLLSATLIAALVFLPMLALGDRWRAYAVTFGLVTGYFAYSIAHHAAHHWRAETAWTRQRKRLHALHHGSGAQPGYFGVTSAFWDIVFGTNRTAEPARPPATGTGPTGSNPSCVRQRTERSRRIRYT